MCAVLRELIFSHQNPSILNFQSQQLLSCFTWSDELYLELIEWSAPAAYYKISLLLMKKTKHWREAVVLFTQQSSVWPGAGGPAQLMQEWGSYLGAGKGRSTVFCYRLPAAQSWKAGMQRHKNMIYENPHVITALLFSAENFGWQVLSEDNLHVSYLCYFSTHAKITQTLVSFGKNTL